jgi:hypothetical protein
MHTVVRRADGATRTTIDDLLARARARLVAAG